MAYTEVYTVVDGALDEEFDIEDGFIGESVFDFDGWLDELKHAANTQNFTVDVYEIEHEHDEDDGECSCVQYLTDHHPSYTFGPEEE